MLVTATALLAAIVIFRSQQWTEYLKKSGAHFAVGYGLIWAYSTVAIAIITIILAVAKTLGPHPSNKVFGAPVALFFLVAGMTLIDIISPAINIIIKLLQYKKPDVHSIEQNESDGLESSLLKCLDNHPILGKGLLLGLLGVILILFLGACLLGFLFSFRIWR